MDPDRLQQFARALVRMREAKLGSARAVAKELHLSEGSLSQFKSGKIGMGVDPLMALASACGLSFDQMAARATEWDPATDPGVHVEPPDRYPARVKAIARAREDGRSDRAIEAVASMQGKDAESLTVEAWSALIGNFEAAFAAGRLGAAKKKP